MSEQDLRHRLAARWAERSPAEHAGRAAAMLFSTPAAQLSRRPGSRRADIGLFGRMRFAMGQNQLALRIVEELATSGMIETHIVRMRALYRDKMRRLVDALRKHAGPWLTFREPQEAARRLGIACRRVAEGDPA